MQVYYLLCKACLVIFMWSIALWFFLIGCSLQASSQEGASKVYDEKFKQSLQTSGAILPEFQEGDAKALVAYLNVLQKVLTFFFSF